MHFTLIDAILEQTDDRIVAIKQVSLAEEYLGDHFPGFPVLPGVLMIEAMAEAARRLLSGRVGAEDPRRFVLGAVKALRFGALVRPGDVLQVEVTIAKEQEDGSVTCKGTGTVLPANDRTAEATAAAGRFTMRRTAPVDTGAGS